MARRIFEDSEGLYFRAYDKNKRLVKVYCDEEGNPIKGRKVVPIILEEDDTEEVAAAGVAGGGVSLKKLFPLLISLLLVGLVAFVGYFAYNKYANANPRVDISSSYDISFAPTGYNGEAKAGIKVNKIPTVDNVKDETQKKELEEILNNPRVSYNKTEGLRNGDDVEVTVVLDETKVKKHNLQVNGTYKKTFKVEGLGEKPAVAGIAPANADQSSTSASEGSNNTNSSENNDSQSAGSAATSQASNAGTATAGSAASAARTGAASNASAATAASTARPTGTIPVPRTVKPAAANIRTGAGTNATIAAQVSKGRTVTEVRRVQNAKGETWSQVTYGNGKQGWIKSSLLG